MTSTGWAVFWSSGTLRWALSSCRIDRHERQRRAVRSSSACRRYHSSVSRRFSEIMFLVKMSLTADTPKDARIPYSVTASEHFPLWHETAGTVISSLFSTVLLMAQLSKNTLFTGRKSE
jgi:hypothetical protein